MHALLEFDNLKISQRTEFSKVKISDQNAYNKLNEINDDAVVSFFKGEIKDSLFATNRELKKVIIPDNVINIGKRAFLDCRNLEEVIIPITVTNIDEYAFGMCHRLQSIVLPSSIEKIGKFAFSGCPQLETITWRGKIYYKYRKINEDTFDTLFSELEYLNITPEDISSREIFY